MKKITAFLKNDAFHISLGAALLISAIILEHTGLFTISIIFYVAALVISGIGVFIDAVKGIVRGDLLDEKFLMSIASVGAMIIGEYTEGVAVMLFFLLGETFERIAVKRSRKSIRSLMDFCPDEANVIIDGAEEKLDAEDVAVGSIIVIRPGERVPLDCVIVSGNAEIDTSSMTGEAVPVAVKEGDVINSGVIVLRGFLNARTIKTADNSSAQRILELVENASENKSKEENFITKFSHVYTPTVVALAVLLAVIPPIFGLVKLEESIYRALIFLVISCPCALVISVPMAFFGGIGGSASRGILFKGGNVFAKLSSADSIAFDKTGTLTTGQLSVASHFAVGVSDEELFYITAVTEYASNHPIAKCLKGLSLKVKMPDSAEEFIGEGAVAEFDGNSVAVGNALLMERVGASVPSDITATVMVAKNGEFVGYFVLTDEVKLTAANALNELKELGVLRQVILSGDRHENVERVALSLGINEYYSHLSPTEKYDKLRTLNHGSSDGVIYVGDGINDAPSLAGADIGIAMGGVGQDSAIEAADIVLMSDEIDKIPEAKKIAKKTLTIAKENIVFALGIKFIVMVLGAFGIANMWLAVFADVGVAVLAILNSMRALAYSRKAEK